MIMLDDARWVTLQGGYRIPFDASVPLRKLSDGAAAEVIWEELWSELHHQGNVGEASYAAIPVLVDICKARQLGDWNLFALASTIETCRIQGKNPSIPNWLEPDYHDAWKRLFEFGIEQLRGECDELTVRSVLSVIALHKGSIKLGRILNEFDASEIEQLYDQFYEGDNEEG